MGQRDCHEKGPESNSVGVTVEILDYLAERDVPGNGNGALLDVGTQNLVGLNETNVFQLLERQIPAKESSVLRRAAKSLARELVFLAEPIGLTDMAYQSITSKGKQSE